jgi:hypothetical protein
MFVLPFGRVHALGYIGNSWKLPPRPQGSPKARPVDE